MIDSLSKISDILAFVYSIGCRKSGPVVSVPIAVLKVDH